MDQHDSFRIQADAARALAEWKALFAEEVATKAKELAKKSDASGVVTLDHYRGAASLAVQVLITAIQDTDCNDGRQKAA